MSAERSRSASPLRAAALGLIQGPAELLPISSSAHVEIAESLAGWHRPDSDASDRKAFEVALHAGAAVALAATQRRALASLLREMSPRRALVAALATAPAAVAGLALHDLIEQRLSGGTAAAAGLATGAAAMAVADSRPQIRGPGTTRAADGLALGAAQAAALVPGVSRSGATLSVARARGFTREQSARLSWGVALPVVAGALALKGPALRDGLRDPRRRGALLAGSAASTASTIVAVRVLGPPGRPRRLWPYALYRLALAFVAWRVPAPRGGAIE